MAQVGKIDVVKPGDGVTTIFDFDFPYLAPVEIFVSVDGVDTSYTWLAGSTSSVQLPTAPALGAKVRIYRSTAAYTPRHVFSQGVPFLPRYVDENNTQMLFALGESIVDSQRAYDTAIGIDAKATEALEKSSAAITAAQNAETVALAIDGKAQEALDASAVAVDTANEAMELVTSSGVNTFNGRQGIVVSESGDYNADQITTGATTVEARLDGLDTVDVDIRNRAIPVAVTFPEIKAMFEVGGVFRIKNAEYYATETMFFDYDGTVSFPGLPGARQGVLGQLRGGTILRAAHAGWVMESVSPAPFTQAAGGFDEFGNFTISGLNVTSGLGQIGDGKGLRIANRAQTYIHDIEFNAIEQAFHLDGVLSSVIERVDVSGCPVPSVINTTDLTSSPNAVTLNNLRFASCPNGGLMAEAGTAMLFNVLTMEHNGKEGLGVGAVNLYSSHEPFAGTVSINQPYAELNHGLCDIYIENKTTAPMTVIIQGGLFARVSPTAFVQNHVVVNSTGGGTVDVYMYHPEFIEGFGYPASGARPLWREVNDKCRVHCINPTLRISPDTPVPLSHTAKGHVAMHLEPGGGLYAPGGWSAAAVSTGVTRVTCTRPFARNIYSYTVHATCATFVGEPDLPLYRVRARRESETSFLIIVSDDAGNPYNGGVDISVASMA